MALTFQEMQVEIQQTVGTSAANMLDHIKKAINLAYGEMAGISPQYWVFAQKTLAVSGATQTYDLDATVRRVRNIRLPVDVVGRITIVNSDAWRNLITDYDLVGTPRLAKAEDLGTSNEMKLYLHPIPHTDDAGDYLYDAECRPTDLSGNSDTTVFGSQWDACLMDGARYELHKILGHGADEVKTAHAAYMERFQMFAAANAAGVDGKGA